MTRQLRRPCAIKKPLRSPALSIRGNIEVTSTEGAHLAREKSDERQTHPLAEAERPQELLLGMAKSGLYHIHGRDWQPNTSIWRVARWTEGTARVARDQTTLSQNESAMADCGLEQSRDKARLRGHGGAVERVGEQDALFDGDAAAQNPRVCKRGPERGQPGGMNQGQG